MAAAPKPSAMKYVHQGMYRPVPGTTTRMSRISTGTAVRMPHSLCDGEAKRAGVSDGG